MPSPTTTAGSPSPTNGACSRRTRFRFQPATGAAAPRRSPQTVDTPAARSAHPSGSARPRRVGSLVGSGAPRVSDHGCAGYSTDQERAWLAIDWMVAGLELGQRCLYVGEGPHDALLAELPAVLALDVALGSGALSVMSSSEVYDVTAPTDPESQLAVYAATVNRAVADGFAGLRVVADITPLVVD